MIFLAYLTVGFIVAVLAAVHMKIETGTKDDDFADYLNYVDVGLFSGAAWPIAIPIGLIAFAWERINDQRERSH